MYICALSNASRNSGADGNMPRNEITADYQYRNLVSMAYRRALHHCQQRFGENKWKKYYLSSKSASPEA